MASKKCINLVKPENRFQAERICGAEQFFSEEEQCPKFCAHCGGMINADYVESIDEVKSNLGIGKKK